jgi:hypothetical protein
LIQPQLTIPVVIDVIDICHKCSLCHDGYHKTDDLQKICGKKQKNMWSKFKKEYCKENCIDRSVIEHIIIDLCDDDWHDDTG